MGMFDYIKCELPLPAGQDWIYQTKDTQEWCEMKQFTIRSDGRLIKHEYEMECTPEDELPHKDAPKNSLLHWIGSLRKKAGSDRDVDQNFDGDVVFYGSAEDIGIDEEYRATFREGTCVEICRLVDGKWKTVWRTR